jgi:hypothetical protein
MFPTIHGKYIQRSDINARENRVKSRELSTEIDKSKRLALEAQEVLRLAREEAAKIIDDCRVAAHNEKYAYAVDRIRNGESATKVAEETHFYRNTLLNDSKKPLVLVAIVPPENNDEFYSHQSLEDAVIRVCGGERVRDVHRDTGIPYASIWYAHQRYDGNRLTELHMGRPTSLLQELIDRPKASALLMNCRNSALRLSASNMEALFYRSIWNHYLNLLCANMKK